MKISKRLSKQRVILLHLSGAGGKSGFGFCFFCLSAYLAFGDFSQRLPEEGSPGREEVFLRVLLQAAVAAAHRASPRHLRGKALDSNSAALNPPEKIFFKRWIKRAVGKLKTPDESRDSSPPVSLNRRPLVKSSQRRRSASSSTTSTSNTSPSCSSSSFQL